MATIPSQPLKTLIPGTEFRALVRWWLGVPLLAESQARVPCSRCRSPMDIMGHHLVCYKLNKPVRRHVAIQDTLLDLARKAGINCK